MGKPYGSELTNLASTYNWASHLELANLKRFGTPHALDWPAIFVASGGSSSAAYFAVLLHQQFGGIAKAVTPLEFATSFASLRRSSVLLLSAGGRNPDILAAFRHAISSEPRDLLALCLSCDSPLFQLSKKYAGGTYQGFEAPWGNDGFLATNSLLAFCTLLLRTYQPSLQLPDLFAVQREARLKQVENILDRDNWVVLYGGWTQPAAIDLESRFTEAALGHVQLADFRNFGHGRHHWLAKRPQESAVLVLVTPAERELAVRTLEIIPSTVPRVLVESSYDSPIATLDLLIDTMSIAGMKGTTCRIDPGRPGVPPFGRQLYHLRAPSPNSPYNNRHKMTPLSSSAIQRKAGRRVQDLGENQVEEWLLALSDFERKLYKTPFGALVLDYDGTLCETHDRFDGPSPEVVTELTRLLEEGVLLGIATGRGVSVRRDLRKLPASYHAQITIGYYNGADSASLTDSTQPDRTAPTQPLIRRIYQELAMHPQIKANAVLEERPNQLSVEPHPGASWNTIKSLVYYYVAQYQEEGIRVWESGHSLNVLAPGVSKVNLVSSCADKAHSLERPKTVLCIGDQGAWPGNDCELLSLPHALSVDTVSPEPTTCWNLAPMGVKGAQATLYYLRHLTASNGILRLSKKAVS